MNSPVPDWRETIETTVIHGYQVELIIEMDGEDIASSAMVTLGDFGASFAYLSSTGALYHNDADHLEQPVPERTILAIEDWLLEHGY